MRIHRKIYKDTAISLLSFPTKLIIPNLQDHVLNDICWVKRCLLIYKYCNSLTGLYRLDYHLRYISREMKAVVSQSNSVFEILKNRWLNYFSDANDEIKTYMCYLFMSSSFIDEDISKQILSFAFNTKNQDYRYWITQNVTMSFFAAQKGFFNDYYVLRKRLLEKIAVEGKYRLEYSHKEDDGRFSLCIVAYVLQPTIKNSLSRVIKMVTEGLEPYINEIHLISLDSYYGSRDDIQLSTYRGFGKVLSSSSKAELKSFFGNRINIHYVKNGNYHERLQDALNVIASIRPSCILDISDELSPISYIYQKYYPTVYLPMRDATSSSFFDYIVGPKWQIEECNKKYRAIDSEKIIDWIFPEYVPEKKDCYKRERFNISDSSFVILTIAKCSDVCNKDFQDRMARLLYENDAYIWLIVGDTAPLSMHCDYKELFDKGKIRELAYENNLYGLCSVCDVLLRTDTTGGSGSTAIAAMAGLPIVMTNYSCDCMRWLGDKYSTIDNYEKLFLEIDKLYNNHNYYLKRKQEVLELVERVTDVSAKWKEFAEILRQCAKEKSISEKLKN